MNNPLSNMSHLPVSRRRAGFTLIELLIVIAIIALLASMVFPITKALNRTKLRNRARGELAQLQTAIDAYKAKYGIYPPDNFYKVGNKEILSPRINQLYFELFGTERNPDGSWKTLDGGAQISPGKL